MSGLHTSLLKMLSAKGWLVRSDGSGLSAEREGMLAKWILGQRRIILHLALYFDERSKTAFYTESAVEESKGLAPRQRADAQIGMAEHAEARKWLEQACKELGWRFVMMPKTAEPQREK